MISLMIHEYFPHIAIINLKKRTDRLELATKTLDDIGINYEVWEATENEQYPCRGLVDSMQRYFRKVLSEGGERCLVFEDDIVNLFPAETVPQRTIEKCIQQLPDDWDLFYLGCNPVFGFENFYSENLLPLKIAYATHAVAYSKRAMEFIIAKEIKEPIDNFIVREFQPTAKCYASYPMIFSQRPDYSDIGKAFTDWRNFLEVRFNAEVKKIQQIMAEK